MSQQYDLYLQRHKANVQKGFDWLKTNMPFGGEPDEWQHCKGIGTIDYHGEEIDAEVHWFQEPSVGKHKFKIKKWED